MSRNKPTRYSPNKAHIDYGIKNWFRKIGLNDQRLRESLINGFLEDFGFDFTNRAGNARTKEAKNNFIDKRFKEFVIYIQKNKKFYEQLHSQ